jgi:two-component sensor histidine kinase
VSGSETPLAAQSSTSFDPVEDANRLFLDRIRLGLWLVLAGIVAVFFGELYLGRGDRPLINAVQAINFAAVAIAVRVLHEPARRTFNHAVGFVCYVITLVAIGACGIFANDATTPVILFVGLAVVTATIIPWSPWWQLISVLVVIATAIWTVATVAPSPRLFWLQNVGTIAPTLASTVFISDALRRQRAAIERTERERHEREARLRQANVRLEQEIQEHKRTEDALRFTLRELDHRVKNTLATVQSVAHQTLRSSRSMEEFGEAFYGRIQAMARIHSALAGRRWEGLPLTELIDLVVGPYRHHAGSVSIECDGSFVSSELVRVLGMTLHELATNAAKYGALSTKEGRLAICSRVEATCGNRLRIRWVERDGPPVSEPTRRGFGMRLIEEALAYEMEGTVALRFRQQGLQCDIELPVPQGPR